ncbi:hypothetical protein LXL04_004186 [Taraxacum kok-saghyz]
MQKYREVDLKRLEEKERLIELDELVKTLTTNCSAAKQESLFYQQMSEQHAGDLSWLLKQGIPLSIGLTQACEEMRAKYPLLADEPLLHSYPHSQEELMDRFATITGYEYQLLKVLTTGSMDVESLKKYLDEGENDESSFVNEEPKGQGEGENYAESGVDRSGPVVDEVGQTGGGDGVNLGDGEKGVGSAGHDGDDDSKKDAGEKYFSVIVLYAACLSAESLRFSSIKSKLCRRSAALVCAERSVVLVVRRAISIGITASAPYTKLNGVSCVSVRTVVRLSQPCFDAVDDGPVGHFNQPVRLWVCYRAELLLDVHFLTPAFERFVGKLLSVIADDVVGDTESTNDLPPYELGNILP